MTLELLVAAMHKEPLLLAEEMRIDSDAIIVNQCEHYSFEKLEYKGNTIKYFAMAERGVGLSRNTSLLRATSDICLFADEDIVYEAGYKQAVLDAFEAHPEADMLIFNVEVAEGRQTYHIDNFGRVRWYNCGRYGACSLAARTSKLHSKNITFSLLFGGGAKYSNGEDSLFLAECIRKGLKVYKVPVLIGKENGRESTWFKGYDHKYFFDRGVLYHYLYGSLDKLMAIRFLLAHKKEICKEISVKKAFQIMCDGIREGRQ